ncbi:MAG TPA: MFS transporter [Candidatus Dormibacteraeota bacterium]|nr:MFS transporter [Candidatus Dormibacteraeota bacterium]
MQTPPSNSPATAALAEDQSAIAVAAEPAVRRWPPPALAVRPYRWYWASQWPVFMGTWMQTVALGYYVYKTTGSQTAVGVVGAADGIPAVVLSLYGGVLADRLPRRRILLVTQSVLGLSAGVLALMVASGHASLAVLIVIAVVFGSADALDLPTRQALIADLVSADLVVNAVALGSVAMSVTRIAGPSLAGLLIATVGPAVCFGFLALAYIGPLFVLLTVVPDIPPRQRLRTTAFADLVEALRLLRRDSLVRGIIVCVSALSFFGVAYMPYLPVYAHDKLHAGSQVLGLLYTTGGFGALVGSVFVATLGGRVEVRRRLLLVGAVIYAASLFTLATGGRLGFALPALVGISLGFLAMNTSMVTLIQTETDPAMRGRLLGFYSTILAGLQTVGTLTYGLLAHAVPLFTAISIGALVVGAVGVSTALGPALRRRSTAAPA